MRSNMYGNATDMCTVNTTIMRNMKKLLFALAFALVPASLQAQGWTLQDVIELALEKSPSAQSARHSFRSSYWDYRRYRANHLPSLTLSSNPYMDRSINKVTMQDGTVSYVEQNYLSTDARLSLSQNIAWTGGTLQLQTGLSRLDMFSTNKHSWNSTLVNLTYSQNLFGYNSFRWERRTEPLRYEMAQRSYVEEMEFVSATAIDRFFNLLSAQSNLQAARTNFEQADTLYRMAQGRYRIGTITENEMLQLRVDRLTQETNLMDAELSLRESQLSLMSFLGMAPEDTLPELLLDTHITPIMVSEPEALQLAHQNSPDIISMKLRRVQADAQVASARANAGVKADLYVRFGLTQTGEKISEAYHHPLDQQTVSIGLTIPILDWGKGKGQIRVAKSQRDLTNVQIEQSLTDFDKNIRKLVNQFNLQARRVEVAAITDSTAQRRSEVARHLYLLGRSSVLDLKNSIEEKDIARRAHINAVHTYWSMLYTLRSIMLHDPIKDSPLLADYNKLIEN